MNGQQENKRIYFDSAATSVPFQSAIDAAVEAMQVCGNPSSIHFDGLNAKKIVDNARKDVANALGCKIDELVFTGGGSESNNQAIFGMAKLRVRRSKRIIITDSEHPSVSGPVSVLADDGFEVVRIPTLGGRLDMPFLENALKDGAAFVSVMQANNETGAKYDLSAVRSLIQKSGCGALLHCDAVQGFLKVDNKREIVKNCDLASISAHKIGGLKGVGALYVKSGIRLPAFVHGGGQERGLRSGTENVVGIASFGAAVKAFDASVTGHISELYTYLTSLLSQEEGISLHVPESHVDTVLSIAVSGVRSEVMLNALNTEGISVSAGSACSARKGVSHALAGYGLDKEEISSTLRISLGAHNTKAECDLLAEKLAIVAKRLRR